MAARVANSTLLSRSRSALLEFLNKRRGLMASNGLQQRARYVMTYGTDTRQHDRTA